MDSQSLSPTRVSQKARGTCQVCRLERKLHDKDGRVYRHGPRDGPCLGSHKPPLEALSPSGLIDREPPLDTPDMPNVTSFAPDALPFLQSDSMPHPTLQHRLLKHIPKAARHSLCGLLTTVINRILLDPLSPEPWRLLLSFGAFTLTQTVRGGKRHNLTSKIKARVENFFSAAPSGLTNLFAPQYSQESGAAGRRGVGGEQALAAAVAAKLEDGNIRAAARILCSDDKPAPINEETLEELRLKHPSPPPDRPSIPLPTTNTPFQATEAEVMACIRTFPNGSSGGPDGLRPQHILEMVTCAQSGPELLSAITSLTNLLLAGTCPDQVRASLFGGTLLALRKSLGGLRPIVIGYLWRRLAAKCANAFAVPRVVEYLSPRQVGVGVPGGCEAAVHAARRFLGEMAGDSILIKLDFSNAFNSLYRDRMLDSIYTLLPELSHFCHLAYSEPSNLKFGEFSLLSQVGPQQGDPLGPLLFCLPLQPILSEMASSLVLGYLDDLTLGGSARVVDADVEMLECKCKELGLQLNRSKCEVVTNYPALVTKYNSFSSFSHIEPELATLLGAPLSSSRALSIVLEARSFELLHALERLGNIARHDALVLLRYSLSSSKLLHILRCSPCAGHPGLQRFDSALRDGLCKVLNLSLSDDQWLQASLPIKAGGLGIRLATSLALPAFLASAAGSLSLQSNMLGDTFRSDPEYEAMLVHWLEASSVTGPDVCLFHKQSYWDKPLIDKVISHLNTKLTDPYHQARFKAVSAPHSGDWLFALPITSCGLRLDDEAVRVAVGLRLGAPLCEPHSCVCGSLVTAEGSHGLSCGLGPGRTSRHASLNDLIFRSLTRAGYPSAKEPVGLLRTDGKRPDGLTLIPWRAGRSLVWDVTVTDTLANSYLPRTSRTAGAAAEMAADRKEAKYTALAAAHHFVPLAFETMGPVCSAGLVFLSSLGKNLSTVSGDARETSYLFQRLALTIQRFNAVAFRGTFNTLDSGDE